MTRISSRSTFFYKRVIPAFWFGFIGLFVVTSGAAAIVQQQFAMLLLFIVGPLFMAIFGYAIMRWFVFGLVDEVWDSGDSLVVKDKGLERRVALSDVMHVDYTGFMNPPRVTLSLRESGTDVSFIPPFRLFPYSMPQIARDLSERIDAAQRLT